MPQVKIIELNDVPSWGGSGKYSDIDKAIDVAVGMERGKAVEVTDLRDNLATLRASIKQRILTRRIDGIEVVQRVDRLFIIKE